MGMYSLSCDLSETHSSGVKVLGIVDKCQPSQCHPTKDTQIALLQRVGCPLNPGIPTYNQVRHPDRARRTLSGGPFYMH